MLSAIYKPIIKATESSACGANKPEQRHIVASGKAHTYIMLAQSLEQQKIPSVSLPSITELREQAKTLGSSY